jgi:hypothetical protein
VYVVAPVPASVKAASKVTGQIPHGVMAKAEPPVNKSAPTPRLGGHPDLTGNWAFTDWIGTYETHDATGAAIARRCGPGQEGCGRSKNQTEDFELYSPSRVGDVWLQQVVQPRGPLFYLTLSTLPLANTGLSMVPPIWNGNDSFPSFSVPPASRANRFVTNPC